MKEISGHRLFIEWKNWRKDHPAGIKAQPSKNPNGTLNLRQWECSIPGPKSTPWEGGWYKLIISFPNDFPVAPPKCRFDPPVFHPNVFPSGEIVLPELCEKMYWCSDLTIEDILLRIKDLLIYPDLFEAAESEAKQMYLMNFHGYEKKVRIQAKFMAD
ncbi:hypothetical protein KR054_002384 [Drosophila jambulina]|nr:hypothetical protein KR054_002384 [Drosophila jambulina]